MSEDDATSMADHLACECCQEKDAEITRLRAALEGVVATASEFPLTADMRIKKMLNFAREALGEKR